MALNPLAYGRKIAGPATKLRAKRLFRVAGLKTIKSGKALAVGGVRRVAGLAGKTALRHPAALAAAAVGGGLLAATKIKKVDHSFKHGATTTPSEMVNARIAALNKVKEAHGVVPDKKPRLKKVGH